MRFTRGSQWMGPRLFQGMRIIDATGECAHWRNTDDQRHSHFTLPQSDPDRRSKLCEVVPRLPQVIESGLALFPACLVNRRNPRESAQRGSIRRDPLR